MKMLHMDERGAEQKTRFLALEHELLRLVQRKQQHQAAKRDITWTSSALVTTVLFNLVVTQNTNSLKQLK